MIPISFLINEELKDGLYSDFELVKASFSDDIIEKNSKQINFLIKLNYEINITPSIFDLLHQFNLDDLIINDSLMYLPYWIHFIYNEKSQILTVDFYVYWLKYNKSLIDEIRDKIQSIEDIIKN